MRLVRHVIAIGPTAAVEARDALASVADTVTPRLLSHAQLLVSELVTQRVRLAPNDGDGVLQLDISLTPRYLRVAVTDDDLRALPHPSERSSGLELQLVAELSDRWGMRHDASTTLWSELDL